MRAERAKSEAARIHGEHVVEKFNAIREKFSIFLNAFPFRSLCYYGLLFLLLWLFNYLPDKLTDRQRGRLTDRPTCWLGCMTKVKSSGQKPDVCVEVEVEVEVDVGFGFGYGVSVLLCG